MNYVTIVRVLSISAIVILFMISCGGSKHSKSKRLPPCSWQDTPIKVDGYNNDWPSPYPEYDDKAMIGYAVSNDKNNLYITMETGDEATQLKILREGLTVWIDKTGENNELTAINFPLPTQTEENNDKKAKKNQGGNFREGGSGKSEQQRRLEIEDKVRALLPDVKEFSLQGFKGCNLQFPLMEDDTCGIKVRIAVDSDNEMVWEAVVPLRAFYTKSELARADRGKPVSVCFETVGMKRPANSGQGGSRGGGGGMHPGFGMGGMGMGGMHMGGGGGRGGNSQQNPANNIMEPAYKSSKTWKKFGLAFPTTTPIHQ